jgi:tRNA (guanine26-N2/guanine27-N2)-dimethyltransferase
MGVSFIFAHQAEHYARVYCTIKYGAKHADESLRSMGYILHCFNCLNRETVKRSYSIRITQTCSECGSEMSIGGPMWIGKLFNREFCGLMKYYAIRRKMKLGKQIEKMLALAESEADAPVSYFVIDKLCDAMSLPVPSVKDVAKAVRGKGFEASLTIFHTRGVKSELSVSGMKEIVRELASTVRHSQE